ncbi:Gfo/Idh/MocA family oxidoreductase [Compostibacter hankyongensis]|uniref:Gfo/Idh/MocA family oxidoreductase n=1 Tax=Compostibacter hankyongensis TaxID=1007089 RepID=A0ABP8G0Y1_9BACT
MHSTRRDFLKNASLAAAGTGIAGLTPLPLFPAAKRVSPNEKIVVALIGARNMGFGDLENAMKQPGVECAALCDIDDEILNRRAADVEKRQGKAPEKYKDFRKLLERKDVDAVIIGTPDHWHCLIMAHACEAGKDVYVEKPMANSIGECNAMVKAARRYNRVVQVGQQQRSGAHWKQAMDFMKAGKIGQLRKVLVWGNFGYGIGQKKVPDSAVPPGVDFDMWLGPAPQRSFNAARFHGSWRMFWDYGGGLITDWGVHLLDMALWVKDIKEPPLAVMSSGGNRAYPDHAHETFDTLAVNYELKDYDITWQHTAGTESGPYGRNYGLAYIGNDATLVIDRGGWELFPEKEKGQDKVPDMPFQKGRDYHEDHMKNFLECIKSRKDPNCTVENARLVALYAHAGNLSLRTRSRLEWDEGRQHFRDNPRANALITPAYRRPWKLPG